MKLRAVLLASMLGALVHACGSSSTTSSPSSSMAFITCRSIDDCTGIGDATACESGFCVDATGARVSENPAKPSGSLSACNPLAGQDGGASTLEYVADVEGGGVLVVTHPAASSGAGVRAFYGQPPRLDERPVIDAELVANGNGRLTFEVGTESYTAYFMWITESTTPDGGSSGHPDLGTLDEGGGTMPTFTVRWPTPSALPGYSFACL